MSREYKKSFHFIKRENIGSYTVYMFIVLKKDWIAIAVVWQNEQGCFADSFRNSAPLTGAFIVNIHDFQLCC